MRIRKDVGMTQSLPMGHRGKPMSGFASRLIPVFLSLAMAFSLPGCGILKKRGESRRAAAARKQAASKREPLLVGHIALINLENGFVLIDSGSNPGPASGITLKSRTGALESAELRVSEIRRHPFTIADIIQGVPNKGDFVYQ